MARRLTQLRRREVFRAQQHDFLLEKRSSDFDTANGESTVHQHINDSADSPARQLSREHWNHNGLHHATNEKTGTSESEIFQGSHFVTLPKRDDFFRYVFRGAGGTSRPSPDCLKGFHVGADERLAAGLIRRGDHSAGSVCCSAGFHRYSRRRSRAK
jgi:hypothetical protein